MLSRWNIFRCCTPCDGSAVQGAQQGGDDASQSGPPRGATPTERASQAIDAIEQAWDATADASHSERPCWRSPKELAIEFHTCLQSRPELHGFLVPASWIKASYPRFCKAKRVDWAPPYKDFSKELAMMPRKRIDHRRRGQGTCTMYLVLSPATAAVELAKRKRA